MSANARTGVSHLWLWPDSLDAVRAAREYHRVLLENEHVRVLEVRIKPGQIVPVHTHRWPAAVYVISASDFIRRDDNGNLLFDSRTAGPACTTPAAQWTEPLQPHSVVNIGGADIHLIEGAGLRPRGIGPWEKSGAARIVLDVVGEG